MLHELSHDDRPRERLERAGIEALSDVELLALLLRTGHRGASALDLARRLHARYPSAADLAVATPHELASLDGESATLLASVTVAERHLAEVLASRAFERPEFRTRAAVT